MCGAILLAILPPGSAHLLRQNQLVYLRVHSGFSALAECKLTAPITPL
ncbi:L-asparaginase [Rahnella sp. AA]|nr:L-asparaginase [Rahnella sp. AA]